MKTLKASSIISSFLALPIRKMQPELSQMKILASQQQGRLAQMEILIRGVVQETCRSGSWGHGHWAWRGWVRVDLGHMEVLSNVCDSVG